MLPERVLAAGFLPSLSTGLAEQIGWPRYVEQIDRVTTRIRADDPGVVVPWQTLWPVLRHLS